MIPRIELLAEKKLVGQRMNMSLADNQTFQLWSRFMPRRKEIIHTVSPDLYSIQVYDTVLDFWQFNPNTIFEKWAAVEVSEFDVIPEGMETFVLAGGLYAVFHYKGTPAQFGAMAQYIYGSWLPQSAYALDNRPHFELLGAKYKNNDPESEEEVWVPIKEKMTG